MKLVRHFDTFLKEEVNLNQTRIDLLVDSVEAVKSAIKSLYWSTKSGHIFKQ